jgi:hypothetical protein
VPWFRLDDSFHSHPKVIAAGNESIGLYVRCGTYAAEHLTDGFIPEHVALLYGSPALAESLVRTKLWRRTRGGWQMPDYLAYNPSKADVERDRKAAAARQRRYRSETLPRHNGDTGTKPVGKLQTEQKNGKGKTGTGQVPTSQGIPSRRDSHRQSHSESHDPDPTRPDPKDKPMTAEVLNSPLEGVIHSPPQIPSEPIDLKGFLPPPVPPATRRNTEAERKRQIDALTQWEKENANAGPA